MEELQALIQSSIDASRVSESRKQNGIQSSRNWIRTFKTSANFHNASNRYRKTLRRVSLQAPSRRRYLISLRVFRPEAQITPTSSPLQSSRGSLVDTDPRRFSGFVIRLTLAAYRQVLPQPPRSSHSSTAACPGYRCRTVHAGIFRTASSSNPWPRMAARRRQSRGDGFTTSCQPTGGNPEPPPQILISVRTTLQRFCHLRPSRISIDEKKQKQEVNSPWLRFSKTT